MTPSDSVAVEESQPQYGYLADDGFTYREPNSKQELDRVAIVITDVMGNPNVFTHRSQEFLGTLPELVEQGYIYE